MTTFQVIRGIERVLDVPPGETFNELSERAHSECWDELREECDQRNKLLAYGDEPRERSKRHPRTVPASRSSRTRVDREQDPILQYPLQTAFRILTGQPVPQSGMVRCPAPGHEDRHPSCHVGDALFCCFSCGVGGSAYDLGELLSGIPACGESFFELRKWLAVRLLGREEVSG